MRAVVTVTGTDRKGVIASVSGFLAEHGANIEDVSQTILGDQFAMIMMVNIENTQESFLELCEKIAALGREIGMNIRLQHAAIFDAMHNI